MHFFVKVKLASSYDIPSRIIGELAQAKSYQLRPLTCVDILLGRNICAQLSFCGWLKHFEVL